MGLMSIPHLALALGSSLTAGLNLYLTVLALGLLGRFELMELPADLQILSHTWILVTAAALLLVEFIADKIPYVDNTWDAIQGFVRIPAGAVLAAGALGDASSPVVWIAALLGGLVSFSSFGAKASTRLAVNATPEPFTNWFLSFLEDGVSLLVIWLIANHPYISLILSLLLLAIFVTLIYLFYRFFRRLFRWDRQRVARMNDVSRGPVG